MIQYKKRLRPIIECIGLLEHYVNQDIEFKQVASLSDKQNENLKEWYTLIDEAGKIMETKFPQEAYLFRNLNKQGYSSLTRFIVQSISQEDTNVDIKKEFQEIRLFYKKDPCAFLRRIVTSGKEIYKEDIHEEDLPKLLDDLPYDDDMKWKIWKIHSQLEQYLDKIETMISLIMKVYEKHLNIYEELLEVYLEDITYTNKTKDCFTYICEQLNVHFHEIQEVYVIPVLSDVNEITFMFKEKEHKEEKDILFVFWGIILIRKMLHEEDSLTKEQMCTTLKLLSDPSKFDILTFISHKKAYGAQIANELNLSTPTISYHMQALMNAQLVTFEKDNQRLYYHLNKAYLKSFLQQVEKTLLNE